MPEYDWITTRERATELFQAGCHAHTEETIRNTFQHHPALIAAAVERIGQAFAKGTVFNPWGVLKTEAHTIGNATSNVHVTDDRDRDKAIVKAEQWVRAAGIHYDRASEIEDDLFDAPDARLKTWAHDQQLRTRMLDLWQTERPRGQQAETDTLTWQTKLRDDRKRTQTQAAAKAKALLEQAAQDLDTART